MPPSPVVFEEPAAPRASRQRDFGVVGERAPAHAGDHHRDVELDRLLREARAQHGLGGALLAIAFERNARQRAGQKGEVVEGGPAALAQRAEAANAVEAGLGLGLDVFDDRRRKRSARSAERCSQTFARAPPARLSTRACRSSRACGPATTFLNCAPRRLAHLRQVLRQRGIEPLGVFTATESSTTASVPSPAIVPADEADGFVHGIGEGVAGIAANDQPALSAP